MTIVKRKIGSTGAVHKKNKLCNLILNPSPLGEGLLPSPFVYEPETWLTSVRGHS
jgi:hypothetical protein